jgi:FtsZ-binding cell division protein ZapB
MITLKQVEQLNQKIKRAIALIDMLRKENSDLVVANSRLVRDVDTLRQELKESNNRLNSLSSDQELIDSGFQGAMDQLSTVEEQISAHVPLTETPAELATHEELIPEENVNIPPKEDVIVVSKTEDIKEDKEQSLDIY